MSTREPFGIGSVSVGLYLHDIPLGDALEDLFEQARQAEAAGFDGVTLSEHHAGMAGYLPSPVQVSGWLLRELRTAWAAACPVLLPLRPTGLVVEEVAWMGVRYPGRVGVGFAPGYAPTDFEVANADLEDRRTRFNRELPTAVRALTGQATGPLAADPAVAATARSPIPIVSSSAGPVAARRAGRAGAGLILGGFNSVDRCRELFQAYASTGGLGPRLLIRRVWVGRPPSGRMDAMGEWYRQAGADASWLDPSSSAELIAGEDAESVAARLAAVLDATGATALSARFYLPGVQPEVTLEQFRRFGTEVLPVLRSLWRPLALMASS
ncbi:MAG: LLM class flavin-dependent oxidoreductase [Planctomycetes bacterium]|nr:LLM class flavin-dependent oxidoreductase [Planctomycetota bacterium]